MKKVRSLFGIDFTNSRRDSILLYVIISPILLAIGIALFIPTVGDTELIFAAGPEISDETRAALELYAEVQSFNTLEKLEERVAGTDDVPGVYMEGDDYVLLLQGTEPVELKAIAETLVRTLPGIGSAEGPPDEEIAVTHMRAGGKTSSLREILTLMMLMLGSMIGGMTVGFNIVEERSTKITAALAVTPVKMRTYLGAKTFFAGMLGMIVSLCSLVIIMGFRLPWGRLLLALAASGLVAALFGFIMGRFAENQVSALGLMKVLMPLYLTVPLISIFVPLRFHWFFVLFPQYWLFSGYQSLLAPGLSVMAGFWMSFMIFIAETALLFVLTGRTMRKVIRIGRMKF